MLVSLALTLALLAFQRHVVRRTGSMAITADSVHYKSDLLSNVAVLSALVLSGLLGWVYADPVVALGVAAYIGWSALSIGRDAVDVLMDRELPEEDRKRLTALAAGHAAVLGVHDLRTRSAGSTRFVQLHIELNPGLSLAAAHSVADEVEAAIRTEFPDADVIIHTDPHGLEPRSGR
jgi:ferrous-iron efflux pump FieF